ncbi:MAG: prohibitin family protein [Lachnospiraceae bacterium]|nr:prohibitin family protein [Lachnospiraceae bacterium]MBR4816402.1 prohibitin family protein [Lachnospiraceae bacterium]
MLIFVLGLIVGIGVLFAGGTKGKDGAPYITKRARIILSVFIVSVCTIISCIRQVPTGNTGVVVTFGKVEDYTLDSGIHMIAPWKSVVNMDNRTQIYTSELSCFSSDIQEVTVKYSVNYRISKDNAQTIYRTIGAGYLETVMDPKIQEAVKGVTAKYNAEKLVEQRGTLSAQIEEVLKESLTPYNIEVVSTSLANIDFTDAFTNAVEAKQVAEQNKLRAQTEQEQAIIEANAAAERQVIQAQANADSAVLAAKADAEVQQIGADAAEYAGKKEAAILSNIGEQMSKYPGLEKYYYYQNWNGKLPETVLGAGTEIIMDMPSHTTE